MTGTFIKGTTPVDVEQAAQPKPLVLHRAEAFARLEHAVGCSNGLQQAVDVAVMALRRAHLGDFEKRAEKISEFNRYLQAQLVALTARVGEG